MTRFTLLKHPIVILPIAMSLAALAIVLGHIAYAGVAREPDEGAAAHLFQLLIVGQLPFAAFFAIRWVPRAPRQALAALAIQAAAALGALAAVYFLRL